MAQTIRRLFAADRWPWTWSLLIVLWGLTPPARTVAPVVVAAGILAAAVAVELPERRRRDRIALAGASAMIAGVVPLLGLGWQLVPTVIVVAVVARVVGDRYPAPLQRASRADRQAARRTRNDARHAADEAAEVWQ